MSTAHLRLPPLRAGDTLTPEEFLRRWEAMPDVTKAELIEGIVYMPSPIGPGHGRGDSMMICWMGHYAAFTPGCEVLSNTSWSMTPKSLPQPDSALHILPEYGGKTRDKSNHIVGIPELAVEICESSAAYDLGPKLRLYQKACVQEYITTLFGERQIIWRELFEGRYREIFPDRDGLLRSRVFPGLCLDPEAAVAGDVARVLETLAHELAGDEHANFVLNLAKRKG